MAYKVPRVASRYYDDLVAQLPSLEGKSFVVTGTTSGTGKVAALTFAQAGAQVLMLNRPSARADAIQARLEKRFGAGSVRTLACDLQSFASVREAASQVRDVCAQAGVYALVNNAGVMAMPDEATGDGFDVQMQTNHLSHFLLTKELFPLLEQGAKVHGDARIVNHSSIARKMVRSLEGRYLERRGGDLGGNGVNFLPSGPRWRRYGQTKLANAAFTAALHHRLQASSSPIKALVAHPGFANTELQRTTDRAGGMAPGSSFLARFFSQSEEDGALGIISAAALPDVRSGVFYGQGLGMMAARGKAAPYALEAQYDNASTRELLWAKSCEAIGEPFDL